MPDKPTDDAKKLLSQWRWVAVIAIWICFYLSYENGRLQNQLAAAQSRANNYEYALGDLEGYTSREIVDKVRRENWLLRFGPRYDDR